MKRPFLLLSLATLLMTAFFGCQRNGQQDLVIRNEKQTAIDAFYPDPSTSREPGVCNPDAYLITLESRTQVGSNWEWVWSVQNPNPGNGGGGTSQNLSHWGMQFGSCFAWSSVVSAAYSADGITWTSFAPLYQVDPSQSCMINPVLKFNFGTTGSTKSWYKLVLSQNYPPSWVPGYYKSGATTGCCIFNFNGVGCQTGGVEE